MTRSPCTLDGCEKSIVALGYCEKHYRRFKRYGDPLKTSRNPPGMFNACTVDGCDNRPISNGFCNKHWTRNHKYGDPTFCQFEPAPDGAPLAWVRNVALAHLGEECLRYPFALAKGYGQIWVEGVKFGAHRFVCEQVHGPAPTDRHAAAHNCGHSWCVSPQHLRWATYAENEADKIIHGTSNRGMRSPVAKLQEGQIYAIRAAPGTHTAIALEFGVSRRLIGLIKSRKIWTWVAEKEAA